MRYIESRASSSARRTNEHWTANAPTTPHLIRLVLAASCLRAPYSAQVVGAQYPGNDPGCGQAGRQKRVARKSPSAGIESRAGIIFDAFQPRAITTNGLRPGTYFPALIEAEEDLMPSIVFVHGLAKKPDPATLKKIWLWALSNDNPRPDCFPP